MKSADILITGFGPFPGAPVNVSTVLARRLVGTAHCRWPHLRTVALALETDWQRGPDALLQAAFDHCPKVIVMFGISRSATGFHVESCAWNERQDRSDALLPGCLERNRPEKNQIGRVCPAHPAAPALHVGPLADRIVARLRSRGFIARRSSDAGRYLCNAALFHGLAAGRRMAAPTSVFIHLPPVIPGLELDARFAGAAVCRLGNRMSHATALRGGLEIIATCATHAGLSMRRG